MQELHGVMHPHWEEIGKLKRQALLFDVIHAVNIENAFKEPLLAQWKADIEYLLERKFILDIPPLFDRHLKTTSNDRERLAEIEQFIHAAYRKRGWARFKAEYLAREMLSDYGVRQISIATGKILNVDTVPICSTLLRHFLMDHETTPPTGEDVLHFALRAFPVPDESSSWEDILEFKVECHDKVWAFRRFLQSLAAKHKTEGEIRDEIEWMIHQYSRAMDQYGILRSTTFLEAYIIPAVEALENLKPSMFLKGLVAIRKRKIALFDAESNSPGHQCAYVFDARKRFGVPAN